MTAADNLLAVPLFTGMALDRASTERKDPEWVSHQLTDPAARAVLAGHDGVVIRDTARRHWCERAVESRGEPILLGLEDGAARFAVDLDALPAAQRTATVDGAEVCRCAMPVRSCLQLRRGSPPT